MGLLDNFSFDNLNDPNKMGLLAMGLSMLAPKPYKTNFLGDLGSSGMQGLQTMAAAKQQERANRQSDLQQMQGLYNILQNNEAMRWAAAKTAGVAYTPSPEYLALQSKFAKASGLTSLASPNTPAPAVSSPLPGAPPTGVTPATAAAGVAAPSQSVVGNPNYNPPAAAVRPSQPAPMPSASASGFGAPAGGLDMTDYMMAANNPGLKMYVENYAKSHMPMSTRYGIFAPDPQNPQRFMPVGGALPQGAMPYDFDASGRPVINPLPGQLKTQAEMAAAGSAGKAAGEFPFKYETVEMADGRKVPTLVSNVVGSPNVGGLPFLSALFGTPQSAASAQTAPSPQAAPSQVAKVTVTQPSKQAQATPQPSQQPPDPWANVPVVPRPTGVGQSQEDQVMTKLRGDAAARIAEKYGSQADVAQNRIALNNQALELVDRADTGMGAAFLGDVKNLLTSRFGIPESDFKNDPAATAALNKDLMNAAVAKAKASFGARMSTNEVNNMLKRGAPNGDMVASAIKFLLTTDNATANYQIQQAQHLGRYLDMRGNPMRFDEWHSTYFPLDKVLDNYSLPQAGTGASGGWKVERVQ